jgi:hypothetical protein
MYRLPKSSCRYRLGNAADVYECYDLPARHRKTGFHLVEPHSKITLKSGRRSYNR